MSMKLFHICTISNNLDQYKNMKTSFIEAGFDLERCRYSVFDNTEKNNFEPYETFNSIQLKNTEPYIIFCHHDLLLDKNNGFEDLLTRLKELERIDPNWAICGNAGVNCRNEYVVKIYDNVNSPNWNGTFPQQVFSLDENFLVVKASSKIKCSSTISGFHFYATDLCLQAVVNGFSCYVIDFHLSHLGQGLFTDSFWMIKSIFYQNWVSKFKFCYVKTITGQLMCLSNNRVLRYLGSTYFFSKLLIRINQFYPFLYPKKENLAI